MLRGPLTFLLAALCCLLAFPATAAAAKRWVVTGEGYGHGVGMSQYGAYGFAKQGFGYQTILGHYYIGTSLGTTTSRPIRVLLRPDARSVSFSGASSACGVGLKTGKSYVAKRKGGGVVLRTNKGQLVAKCGALLSAAGAPAVSVAGKGTYRGALEVRSSSVPGTVNAINAVELEDYVRGVLSKESPASWPLEALKAQAVAARSYAISTAVRGNGFEVYDDTRSQVYAGVGAETARTDQAVAATALQVVLYQGRVAQTFFFSTSGGHTENNEFSALGFGQPPVPYLRGVDDPYEAAAASPYASWKRKYTPGRMNSALGRLIRGKLKNIVVTQRGTSPRIVRANLIGSGGTTAVTGPQLRDALRLPDTWAYFKKK